MASKPPGRTHEFEIIHNWGDSVVLHRDGTSTQSVRTCLNCGREQRTLHLHTDENAEGGRFLDCQENREALHKAVASFRQLADSMDQYAAELLKDTEFDNLDQVQTFMNQRYERRVSDQDVTLRLIGYLVRSKTRKQKRKVILGLKQGLVCNRCDSPARSLDDLTEDHIIPRQQGGQSKLDNLQLLCGKCNRDKADGQPSDRDRSPFRDSAEPCLHRMTCREFDELCRRQDGAAAIPPPSAG